MKRLLLSFLLSLASFVAIHAQVVEPMVQAKYHQSYPFNHLCPSGCAAGCGPIALAQILYYYQAPRASTDSASYTYNGQTVKVSLDGVEFDWANILDSYPGEEYSDTLTNAVANLVYACGAAMGVKYNVQTSVPNYAPMLYGMQHNMHISVDSRYLRRAYYSTAEWIEMLNQQLRDGHPVFYRGTWYGAGMKGDHMFLIDGINEQGEYHVNFGHKGYWDIYADINYLNQSGTNPGNRGVCYNASQVMVVNCYPTPDFNDYPSHACISEEPIILNKDTMQRSVTVGRGEAFSLSCRLRSCSNAFVKHYYGWALVKDGAFVEMLSTSYSKLHPGNRFKVVSHLDVKLPKTLQDGEYTLQLFSKEESELEWKAVWACAPTAVSVTVKDGRATVAVPDNHLGDPRLYLKEDIREVNNVFDSIVPGRTFELQLANETTNNFENLIRLEVTADNVLYTYELIQPVYSQTEPVLHILIPTSAIDLRGKDITSIKAYYYYDIEKRYIEMGETYASVRPLMQDASSNGDVTIYTVGGILVKTVKSANVATDYQELLNSLPHGIYIIKEGHSTRRISI